MNFLIPVDAVLGFIGHFSSTIPEMFVKSMCVEHGPSRVQGVCPLVMDIRTMWNKV